MAKKKVKEYSPRTQIVDLQGTKIERLKQLYEKWHGCARCGLWEMRRDAQLRPFPEICFGEGNPDAHLMFIGEAPGVEEEASGIPFVGDSGQLLNQILANSSDSKEIQDLFSWWVKAPRGRSQKGSQNFAHFHEVMNKWRHSEFFFTNVISCRPPENRTPTKEEIGACWERLMNIIYIVDPLLIVTVGGTALSAVVGKRLSVTSERGKLVEAHLDGIMMPVTYPVVPIFHPSYLLRKADWTSTSGDYYRTLKDVVNAMKLLDALREKLFGIQIPIRLGPHD